MNTNTSLRSVPHKHAEVIKAWADGAEIEVRANKYDAWELIETPTWFNCLEYRIKTQPKVVKLYSFYDRIERTLENGEDLNRMVAQGWYDTYLEGQPMLEWTFTDNKLTSVTLKG
jgi:hypothetical protein